MSEQAGGAGEEQERQTAKAEVQARFSSIAEGYSKWVLDRPLTEGLFEAFVARLEPELRGRPGAQVLDVASASGEPAATLAAALPLATVHATDLSPQFVQLGKARMAQLGLSNVVCEQADAEDLGQYGTATFDAVTCCMGLMFMPHAEAAVAELARVLKPGGSLVAAVYQGIEGQPFYPFAEQLSREIFPGPGDQQLHQQQQAQCQTAPPQTPYHACRFADPAPLLAAATAAGLGDVECRQLSLAYRLAADEWWQCLASMPDMPLKAALEQAQAAAGGGRDVGGEARQLAERRLRERGWLRDDGSVYCPNNMAWLITANKGGTHVQQ